MTEHGTLGRKASAVLLTDLELEQRREQRLKIKNDLLIHFKEVQQKKEQATDDDTTENEESDEEDGSPTPKRFGRALSNASRSSSFTVVDHSSSTPETRSRASSISDQQTERSTASIDSDDDAEPSANRTHDSQSDQEDIDHEANDLSDRSETSSSEDEDTDDIEELKVRLATSKRLVKEYRLKMEALVKNIGEYKKLMEIEKKSVEQRVSKESEALEQKVKELQNELQASKQQYDETVEAYEAKLDEIEEEKKSRNKENIENLQTLVKELTYIEDINSQLNGELDAEKQGSEKFKQELEISKQVIKQLEIKVARLQEQSMEERAKSLTMSSDSNSSGTDSDAMILRSQLQMEREKVQRVALLISQMRTIVFPSEEMANQELGTVAMKLEAEKDEHVKTKTALEQEKEKRNEDKQTIDKLQKRIKDLIQSHSAALSQVSEGAPGAPAQGPTRKMTLQYSPSLMNLAQIKPDSIPGVTLTFEPPKPDQLAPQPVKPAVATSPASTPGKDPKKDLKKKKKLTEEEKVALLFQWVEEGNPKPDDFAKLLKSSKTLVKATDNAGRTALHKACFNGFAPLIKPLLSAGSEVNAQDKAGWTALHHALKCPQDNSEIVKILLKKSDIKVDIPNFDNNISLHFLIRSPSFHMDFLTAILSRGVNVNLTNNNGESPLHYCCLEAGHDVAATILFKHNANPNIQNKRQETPLHYAARVGIEKMVSFLLDHAADPTIKGVDGTPIELTNNETIKQLLQAAIVKEQNLRLSLKRSRRITIQVPTKTIEQLGITSQATPSGTILDKRPEEIAAETSHRRDSLRNSSVTITIKSPDMTMKSSISPDWTVAHLLSSVKKKFPETASTYNLYLLEPSGTVTKLDQTKTVNDYPKLLDIKELHLRPDEKGLQKSFSAPNPPSSPETARLRRATVSASKFKQQIEEFQELVETNNIATIAQNKLVIRSKSMKQFKGGSGHNSDSEGGSSTNIKDMFHNLKENNNNNISRTTSTGQLEPLVKRTPEQLLELAQSKESQVILLEAVARRYLAQRLKKKYLMHNEARRSVAKDILKLETVTLDALKYILSRFIKPVRDSKHVPRLMKDNILDIGTSLESIQLQTVQVVVALQQRIDGWFPGQRLGDLYLRINTEMVEYPSYASCYYEILPLFKEKQFLTTLQKCNITDISTMTKHLKTPVDYLFRLRKYIKLFLPYTGSDHKDTRDFRTILQSTKKAVDEIRVIINDYDNREHLQKFQSMVTNTIPFNLVSSARMFIKEGELDQKTKTTIKKRHVILFSDMIFVAEKTSKLHMKYIEHIVLKPDTLASDYTMGHADKKSTTTFSFLVTSGGSEPLILVSKSEDDRKAWVEAIKGAIIGVKTGNKVAEDLTMSSESASQSIFQPDSSMVFPENKRMSLSLSGHSWSMGGSQSKGTPLVLASTKGNVSASVVSVLTQEACAVCLTKFNVKIKKTTCKKCGNAVCPNCIKSESRVCLNCQPQNSAPFPLLSLPEKLLVYVFCFLEAQSLCALFLTCKSLHGLNAKNRLWKSLYLKKYNKANLPNHKKDVYKQQYMIESRWENNKYNLSFLKAHTSTISSLKLTEDFLLSASKDMTIKIWNLNTPTPTLTSSLIAGSPIRCMAYNPGKHSVVTGAEKVVKMWDIQAMKSIGSVEAHTGGVVALYYDTQKDTILTAGTDNSVKVIDAKTMKVISTILTEGSSITCMQVHGNFLAVGVGKQMKLFSYPEGSLVQTLGEHLHPIRCLKMNSNFIASGYQDGTVKVFQTSNLGIGRTIAAHNKPVNDIHLDNNKLVSVSSDSTIKIWSLVAPKTTSLHVNGEVSAIDFDNRGLLVSAHSDNIIRCWNYAWKC